LTWGGCRDALYDLILNEVAGAMDAMRRLKLLA
jgi:hypothetical protein